MQEQQEQQEQQMAQGQVHQSQTPVQALSCARAKALRQQAQQQIRSQGLHLGVEVEEAVGACWGQACWQPTASCRATIRRLDNRGSR